MTVAGWPGRMWVSCFRGSSPPRRPAAAPRQDGVPGRRRPRARRPTTPSTGEMMRVWDRLSSARSTSACARSTPPGPPRAARPARPCLRVAWRVAGARPGAPGSCPGGCGPAHRPGACRRPRSPGCGGAGLRSRRSAGRRRRPRDRQRLADHRRWRSSVALALTSWPRPRQVGAGRGQGGHVFAVVDAGQQLAGGDALVVFRQHFLDEAGYLGRDHRWGATTV